ncbi:MAG TPA: hypothetical protein VMM36_09075 [Opitutaceae bacterium]|nr:hypothetical protein [Opitutaceae bacterium]
MSLRAFKVSVRAAVVLTVALGLAGCGKRQPATGGSESRAKSTDFVQMDSETTDIEQHCLDFGRSVMLALAARNYEEFYGQLSSHAKAQMSLNQFVPETDDAKFESNEKMPRRNVALPEFLQHMALAEKFHGAPVKPLSLHVHTSDPAVLAGGATGGFEAIDVMFAIGNMPKLAPASIRKASLRGSLSVELAAEELAEIAKRYEMTVDELVKSEDFEPYMTVKLVIVEEGDSLRVGYFELLPPSMLD